ncbi:hypothetical protein [Synechococcus sp. UW179A]|uniref:hypothetical protein n=1 Tax=Synechococcus sp. UW179A TaxID=2575510 RepID=UPI0010BF3A23|nr:hypothetical protein [Synechococcus sp. UW179A]
MPLGLLETALLVASAGLAHVVLMVVCKPLRLVCEEVLRLIDSFWLGFNRRFLWRSDCRSNNGFCSHRVGSGLLGWLSSVPQGQRLAGSSGSKWLKGTPTASENRLHEGQFCF